MECSPENGKELAEGLFLLQKSNGAIEIANWFEGVWFWIGDPADYSPKDLWADGWHVLKEVDYPEGYMR